MNLPGKSFLTCGQPESRKEFQGVLFFLKYVTSS